MTAVIAHRGAAAEAPENSMEAFELGMRLGADAIELDVRCSADGVLWVVHDATLDRTTDGTGFIAELTREEVEAARMSTGAGIPELADVLKRYPGIEITIDVKDRDAAPQVVRLVHELDRVDETILYVEDGTDDPAFRGYEGRRATSTAQALRLALSPNWLATAGPSEIPEVVHTPLEQRGVPIVTHAFVQRVRESGRSIQVWTIDDADTAGRLAAWGADGIITNDVRRMRGLLAAGGPAKKEDT